VSPSNPGSAFKEVATMATHDGPEQDREAWARQQRRRRRYLYGGLGGGAILVGILIYFLFFSVTILTLDKALKEVARRHPDAVVTRGADTGYATTISNLESSTNQGKRIDTAAAGGLAIDYVQRPEVATALGVPKQAELRVTGTLTDPQRAGYDVIRIQQFVDDVRLFGAEIAVSVRTGPSAAISSVATNAATVPALDMQPTIDEPAARAAAARFYASLAADRRSRLPREAPASEVERIVFDPARFGLSGSTALAWRLRLDNVQVIVDAKDGRILEAFDDRHAIRNRLTSDCNLSANCRLVLNEADAMSPVPPPAVDAVRVHDAAGAAYAYYLRMFGRNGFDDTLGTGGTASIESNVRVRDLNNAQWVPAVRKFEFGLGWTTLDIVGHEYTHAVTQYGPKLEYLGEAGAVNEFFSDFFGAMIERANGGGVDWRIGEGLPGFSVARPLRNMANPHNAGFDPKSKYDPVSNYGQPQHFTELVTTADQICKSTFLNDNGCVHFNSGILNKALQLAVDGGTFQGTTVTGIAREKVEQIMFRTLMLGGVTASSGLKQTASGAVVACSQLLDSRFGITKQDCTAFSKAFTAVGLR
jgi:Zn-dependent metalloprotease